MAESKSYTPSPKYAKIFEGGTLYLRKDGYLIFKSMRPMRTTSTGG